MTMEACLRISKFRYVCKACAVHAIPTDHKMDTGIKYVIFRQSVMSLRIYYQDLSIERRSQETAYDFWSLACKLQRAMLQNFVSCISSQTTGSCLGDIGGTLGLFLGASLLTLFEILDFFLLKPIGRCFQPKRKQKQQIVPRRESIYQEMAPPRRF